MTEYGNVAISVWINPLRAIIALNYAANEDLSKRNAETYLHIMYKILFAGLKFSNVIAHGHLAKLCDNRELE